MLNQFEPISKPTWTPWGSPDHAEQVFAGVWSVYTPSHGGFYVSAERRKVMDQSLLSLGFGGQTMKGWFEEDCDWALVALSFPEEWKAWRGERAAADLEAAQRTLEQWILPKKGQRQ